MSSKRALLATFESKLNDAIKPLDEYRIFDCRHDEHPWLYVLTSRIATNWNLDRECPSVSVWHELVETNEQNPVFVSCPDCGICIHCREIDTAVNCISEKNKHVLYDHHPFSDAPTSPLGVDLIQELPYVCLLPTAMTCYDFCKLIGEFCQMPFDVMSLVFLYASVCTSKKHLILPSAEQGNHPEFLIVHYPHSTRKNVLVCMTESRQFFRIE